MLMLYYTSTRDKYNENRSISIAGIGQVLAIRSLSERFKRNSYVRRSCENQLDCSRFRRPQDHKKKGYRRNNDNSDAK
jgi:hypothetical protein